MMRFDAIRPSHSEVLPWSTCATTHMFRICAGSFCRACRCPVDTCTTQAGCSTGPSACRSFLRHAASEVCNDINSGACLGLADTAASRVASASGSRPSSRSAQPAQSAKAGGNCGPAADARNASAAARHPAASVASRSSLHCRITSFTAAMKSNSKDLLSWTPRTLVAGFHPWIQGVADQNSASGAAWS
jgi:hypothetical protein